jgi:hypothetical protein
MSPTANHSQRTSVTLARSPKMIPTLLLGFVVLLLVLTSAAQAAGPVLSVAITPVPGTFQRGDSGDQYSLTLTNTGDAPTSGTITLTDAPQDGLKIRSRNPGSFGCTSEEAVIAGTPFICTWGTAIAPGETVATPIVLVVLTPVDAPDTVHNIVTVSGGGAPEATFTDSTPVVDRPPFGMDEFAARALDEEGHDYTAAGGHPYEATAAFSLPTYQSFGSGDVVTAPVEDVKDVFTELPPGFIGNASAMPRCSLIQLQLFIPQCPAGSQIGTFQLGISGEPGQVVPLYNMVPEKGHPAEFAFKLISNAIVLYATLRPRTGHYGVTVVSPGADRLVITGAHVVLWGMPSAHTGTGGPIPLLSNPVDCQEANPVTRNIADSWQHPATEFPGTDFGTPDLSDPLWVTATSPAPAVTGCDNPALASEFKPSIDVEPVQQSASTQADQPSGLKVDLDFPQVNDPTDLKTVFDPALPQAPELKDATVTLPAGVSVSPSSAGGLGACSDLSSDPAGDQVHYDNTEPVSCPDSSKIGTVTATSPLLASHDPVTDAVTGAEPVAGDVYVLKPHPGDFPPGGQGGTFRVLIQVSSEKYGINVKLPGTVTANKATGQLTATFTENPQLPVKHLEVDLKSGPRAPLATPTTCGTFTTTTDLVPWSTPGTPDATPSSAFQVSSGANGQPCASTPQQRPFAPSMSGGTESSQAGASAPFVLHLTRGDGEQELAGVNLTMPPGFAAKLTGIPYCSEAAIAAAAGKTGRQEEASPSCPTASQIGTLTTGAGPGSNPYYVNGTAYLAGPYKGASLSVVFITPAVAGPFDLGNVLVRAAVFVNPTTAQVTVKTDPIPQIIDGVPLRLRSIVARIDRPAFTINPTSCNSMSLTGEALSSSGATSTLSSHFQVAGCSALKFAPKFSASSVGQASKANGASLTTKITYPYAGAGAVNLTRVKVQLPKQLPSRLTTLQQACTAAKFEANPASCPAASVIGHATVNTPLLPVPLTGPAYFVSHGGEAFPSVELVLQGDDITVTLVGTTLIKGGITSTTFKTVPDVPFTSFELTLPQGKYSALGANLPAKAKYSFCDQKMVMPTELIAQNGAVIHQNTKIAVAGCKAKALSKAQKLAAALKACKKKSKGKRAVCAKAARRRFATAAKRARRRG